MTVGELVMMLLTIDPRTPVIYHTPDETYAPMPEVKVEDVDMQYWDGEKLETIPKGKKFVEL